MSDFSYMLSMYPLYFTKENLQMAVTVGYLTQEQVDGRLAEVKE